MKKVSTRAWVGAGAAAAVLLGVGGYFLGVQPQQARAASADAGTEASETQTATVRARVATLSRAAAKQNGLESQAEDLDKAVPHALQANTFIRRVNTVAALNGVDVKSVTVGAATAYAPPAGLTAAAAAPATPAADAPAAAAAAAPAEATAPVLAVSDPSITSANLTVIPMTVVVTGTSSAGLAFVKDMQRDERLFLVSGLTTAADPESQTAVTTTLTGSVYAVKR